MKVRYMRCSMHTSTHLPGLLPGFLSKRTNLNYSAGKMSCGEVQIWCGPRSVPHGDHEVVCGRGPVHL